MNLKNVECTDQIVRMRVLIGIFVVGDGLLISDILLNFDLSLLVQ